jgi:hypothetical protein
MIRRWRSPVVLGLIFLSLMARSEVAFGSCIKFPRDAEIATVEVCEYADSFLFRIGDNAKSFFKDEFSRNITIAAQEWLSEHNNTVKLPEDSVIQIWMTVPMANPLAAQPRAVVSTSSGWISFWFDLNKFKWHFQNKETAILGNESYPQSYGHRPASIFVQSQPDISAETMSALLHHQGATSVVNRGNGTFEATCKIFDEKKLASRVNAIKAYVKYAQVNSVMEWIADRQMAFLVSVDMSAK